MAKYEMAIEYKSGHVTRPIVHQTVAAAFHERPEVKEVILRCPSATKAAQDAVDKYNNDAPPLRNRAGDDMRVTLAVGPVKD